MKNIKKYSYQESMINGSVSDKCVLFETFDILITLTETLAACTRISHRH